jgi:hypothetical protein
MFTYRSARSGSLMFGFALILGVETAALHAWLQGRHPAAAWCLTILSAMSLVWLAADYHRLGHGAIVVNRDALDLRIGLRARAVIPREAIAHMIQPTWRDLPAAGSAEGRDYRNLMKPAPPNVLIVLKEPVPVQVAGGVRLPARRIALHVDDPDGFLAAVENSSTALSTHKPTNGARTGEAS